MDTATQSSAVPRISPADQPRFSKPFSDIETYGLYIPSGYEYHTSSGTQYGVMSRQRTDDLVDTVLRKMPEAPVDTFTTIEDDDGDVSCPAADQWLRDQVQSYLSKHTAESIVDEVQPHEMKDYDFPVGLTNAELEIDTGVGYYYNTLCGKTYEGSQTPSKALNGEHDCWDRSSRFRMPLNLLTASHDSVTGETTIQLTNRIWICRNDGGQIGPDHFDSLRKHMLDLVNSDDPKIARELQKTQKLNRGQLSIDLQRLSMEHATQWLKENGLTCSQFTKRSRNDVVIDLDTKHFDTEVTEENVLAGARVAMQALEDHSMLSPTAKAKIHTEVTGVVESLLPRRPEGTTLAQWSQALASTAYHLCEHMRGEVVTARRQIPLETVNDDESWHGHAEADISTAPPSDRYLAAPITYNTRTGLPTTTGYIKVYGQLRHTGVCHERYRRTADRNSRWIPVEGVPPGQPIFEAPQHTSNDGIAESSEDEADDDCSPRMMKQWVQSKAGSCRTC